jgi:hypothetical protein
MAKSVAHRMTPARRAALKKAQRASAIARRRSNKGLKKAYAKKHYRGAGGLHRNVRDFTRGTGAHAIGRKKKLGKAGRVARRVGVGLAYGTGYGSYVGVAHGVSYIRHRRAMKKKRKR